MSRALKILFGVGTLLLIAVLTTLTFISILYPPKTDELLEKTREITLPPFVISNEEAAIDAVRKRTEVFKYEFELSKAGKKASFQAEDRGDAWAVQVFEVVTTGGVSHTATFNWYLVNKQNGNIEPEFSFGDIESP